MLVKQHRSQDITPPLFKLYNRMGDAQEKVTNFVLDEDLHLSNIAQIITRDFYPHLGRLSRDTVEAAPELTLNNYLVNFRSDENETFSQLVENSKKEWKERFWWVDKETRDQHKQHILMPSETSKAPQLTAGPKRLAIEGPIKPTTTTSAESKNMFMFPNQTSLYDADMEKYDKEKKIIYQNTRLEEMLKPLEYSIMRREEFTLDGKIPDTPLLFGIYDEHLKKTGKYELDEDGFKMPSRKKVVETVNGYKLITMPSPSPNSFESPLMTYGEIEQTPQRLPEYQIPTTPKRDLVLEQLNYKINQKKKEDKARKQSTVMRLLGSCTPGSNLSKRKASSVVRKDDSLVRNKEESLEGLLKL